MDLRYVARSIRRLGLPGPFRRGIAGIHAAVAILSLLGLIGGYGLHLLNAKVWQFDQDSAWIFLDALPVYLMFVSILGGTALYFAVVLRDWGRDQRLLDTARDAAAKLTETNVRLQDFAAQSEQLAVANERNRMAREIHDTLGYTLASISRQLDACEDLVRADPDRAVSILRRLGELVRSGLQDVRQSVAALRDAKPFTRHGRRRWEQLITTFISVTGVKVQTQIDQDFEDIDSRLEQIIYRIIQEGLTNAYRHGHAFFILVYVWWEEDKLLVRVSDNGRGVEKLVEGYGMRGIRERVSEVGGVMDWRSTPGRGFDLGVEIPMSWGGWERGEKAGTDR